MRDFAFIRKKDFPVSVDLLSQHAAGGMSTILPLGNIAFIRNKDFPVSADLLSHLVPERQYFIPFSPLY